MSAILSNKNKLLENKCITKKIDLFSLNEYRNLIRKKCIELGFNYLMNKRGSKGKEIEYDKIGMAQYLQPNNQLEVKEKRKIFNSETE